MRTQIVSRAMGIRKALCARLTTFLPCPPGKMADWPDGLYRRDEACPKCGSTASSVAINGAIRQWWCQACGLPFMPPDSARIEAGTKMLRRRAAEWEKYFDIRTTGQSYYDSMLNEEAPDPDYFKREKGRDGRIVMMSPDQYLRDSAQLHGVSLGRDLAMIDPDLVKQYAERARAGEKMPIPILDWVSGDQEGRHRAKVARELGLAEMPVFVVTKVPGEEVDRLREKKYGPHLPIMPPDSAKIIKGTAKEPWEELLAELDSRYPRVRSGTLVGLSIRIHVPNTSSIGATFKNPIVLPGIREVPMSDFDNSPPDADERVRRLAEAIKESGEINPLIVAVDRQGPWVLEGTHRFDALKILGAELMPAMVVLDGDSFDYDLPKLGSVITDTPPGTCEMCGRVDELRPYGPGGMRVCFECAMLDEEEAGRQFDRVLNSTTEFMAGIAHKAAIIRRRLADDYDPEARWRYRSAPGVFRFELREGEKFIGRVRKESGGLVTAIELNEEGDEVAPRGHPGSVRLRVFTRAEVVKQVPQEWDNKYAVLQDEGKR